MGSEITQFKKGHTGGRPKGAVNLLTKTVKETFMDAFHLMQKDKKANLFAWGKSNPTQFYIIMQRVMPLELNATLTGRLDITVPSWFDNTTIIETAYNLLPAKAVQEEIGDQPGWNEVG